MPIEGEEFEWYQQVPGDLSIGCIRGRGRGMYAPSRLLRLFEFPCGSFAIPEDQLPWADEGDCRQGLYTTHMLFQLRQQKHQWNRITFP